MSLNITANSCLRTYNTMAVPAFAHRLVVIENLEHLSSALDYARRNKLPMLVLGGGSNILLTRDYPGLVILNRLRGIEVVEDRAESVLVKVASGENWHEFVCYALSQNWFGLENLALIPGSVGAAPIQNIGAYGAEVKDTLVALEYLDIHSKESFGLNREQCGFAYRDSIFKHSLAGKSVITSVTFELAKHEKINLSYPALANSFAGHSNPTAQQVFDAVCAIRRSKLPLPAEIPNAGSFFKNPVVNQQQYQKLKAQYPSLVSFAVGENYKLAAAWLIEQAGWKQKALDLVCLHQTHALVITNPNGASGAAVLRFAQAIQSDIKDRYDLKLEIEPQLI